MHMISSPVAFHSTRCCLYRSYVCPQVRSSHRYLHSAIATNSVLNGGNCGEKLYLASCKLLVTSFYYTVYENVGTEQAIHSNDEQRMWRF